MHTVLDDHSRVACHRGPAQRHRMARYVTPDLLTAQPAQLAQLRGLIRFARAEGDQLAQLSELIVAGHPN
ncbi:hypothetical protein QI633_17660 [Nocardioides sp. QY071]|uniref:hypothetical protein n=1 Tax=Nocardioides sp. QY071 TaxID=3044187 RepID=UPI00249C6FBC|nr:hypothetical protein [Nocardioides sp. QY071]WGY00360.1 hypothetical protein QI633_17660 [Nocardioides sp. QY071]